MIKNIKKTNEKVIKALYYIFLSIIVITAIAFIVVGIVFWNNSSQKHYVSYSILSGGYYETRTNGLFVGLGYAFFFGGPIVSTIAALLNYVVFGVVFDIRNIRDSLETSKGNNTIANDPTAQGGIIWTCSKCGSKNSENLTSCDNCGEPKQ